MTPCTIPGCTRKIYAKGRCTRHYNLGAKCTFLGCGRFTRYKELCEAHYQQKRSGKPLHKIRPQNELERFWGFVDKRGDDACWNWQGRINLDGYGILGWRKRRAIGAHRVSWEIANGPVGPNLVIDHLCRNRRCVNPRHLQDVTISDNAKRMLAYKSLTETIKRLERRVAELEQMLHLRVTG